MDPQIGDKFGKWTVVGERAPHKNGKRFPCRCECGMEKPVWLNALRSGESKSCRECAWKKKIKYGPYEPGTRFGNWTIIGPASKTWTSICRCDCGYEVENVTRNIVTGLSEKCVKCSRKEHCGGNHCHWKGGRLFGGHFMNQIRYNAKSRGFPFELTIEFLESLYERQGGKCALTGVPIHFGGHSPGQSSRPKSGKFVCPTASLDRIDSLKTYLDGNVQWVHKDLNLMKMDFPQDEFFEWCKRVLEHQGYQVVKEEDK